MYSDMNYDWLDMAKWYWWSSKSVGCLLDMVLGGCRNFGFHFDKNARSGNGFSVPNSIGHVFPCNLTMQVCNNCISPVVCFSTWFVTIGFYIPWATGVGKLVVSSSFKDYIFACLLCWVKLYINGWW